MEGGELLLMKGEARVGDKSEVSDENKRMRNL